MFTEMMFTEVSSLNRKIYLIWGIINAEMKREEDKKEKRYEYQVAYNFFHLMLLCLIANFFPNLRQGQQKCIHKGAKLNL